MNKRLNPGSSACPLYALALCAISLLAPLPASAEAVLYRNARVYTVDAARPWASAIAVEDGHIVAVGDDAELASWRGGEARVVDLQGRFVMPGFHDAHVHPILGGLKYRGFWIGPEVPAADVPARVAARLESDPGKGTLVGEGVFSGAFIDLKALDAVAPQRPVVLYTFGGHSAWVNSAALRAAGIDRDTPAPAGGAIARDASGELLGYFADEALTLLRPVLPPGPVDFATRLDVAREVTAQMSRLGITAFKDAMVEEDDLRAYRELERRGELHQRVATAIRISGLNLSPAGQEAARGLVKRRADYRSALLHPDFVKVFLDGGPGTMALLEPTPLNPQTRPLIDGAALDALVADYDRQGVSIMAHAHGDAAIRAFIDAVVAARRANGTGVRHHVAHCSSIHPQDVSRLVAADVVCDFSPYIWFPSPLVEGARPVLGDAHMERLYPSSMMVAGGATLAGGSDWGYDNADLNPLPFLEALVTRRDPSGRTQGTWGAQWTISVPQAITVFTLNGARALRLEAETGSLEPGKRADFVVLDRNLLDIDPRTIHEARVLMTVFDGRTVYEAQQGR